MKKSRPPLKDDSTLKATLERYAATLARKSEASHVKTLERDLHTFRSAFDALAAAASKPLPRVKRRELGSGLREATANFGLSDAHVDERVRLGETPVANVYDPGIAERSLGRFFSGARWLMDMHREKFKIRDANCWIGGDLSSNHIHDELKENTARPPLANLLWLRPRIVAGIDLLLEDPELEHLNVICSYGNHGRDTRKPYRALGAVHNYEWLFYQWLASLYEGNPRVTFLADESAHQYAHVYDFDLHYHHGDETNYQGGVGGITIPLNKATAAWDLAKKCHYHYFGHWHSYTPGSRIVVKGSVIGYNAYAMSIKAPPEAPMQFFELIDSKRGKTAQSPIWVRARGDMPRAAGPRPACRRPGAGGGRVRVDAIHTHPFSTVSPIFSSFTSKLQSRGNLAPFQCYSDV